MVYNAQYFIDKFSVIPDNRWITGYLGDSDEPDGEHCALGHCGLRDSRDWTKEATSLNNLFRELGFLNKNPRAVVNVNDQSYDCPGESTPKERILIKLLEAQEYGL